MDTFFQVTEEQKTTPPANEEETVEPDGEDELGQTSTSVQTLAKKYMDMSAQTTARKHEHTSAQTLAKRHIDTSAQTKGRRHTETSAQTLKKRSADTSAQTSARKNKDTPTQTLERKHSDTTAYTTMRKQQCAFPNIRLVTEFKSSNRCGAWYKYGNTATWAHRPGPPCLYDEKRRNCEHRAEGNPEKFSQARSVFDGGSNQNAYEFDATSRKSENSEDRENAWPRCSRERSQSKMESPCTGSQEKEDISYRDTGNDITSHVTCCHKRRQYKTESPCTESQEIEDIYRDTGNDITSHMTCHNQTGSYFQTENNFQTGIHHRPPSFRSAGGHSRHRKDTYFCSFMKSKVTKFLFCMLAVAVFIFIVRLAQREIEWERIGIPNFGLQLHLKRFAHAQIENIDYIIDSILPRHRSSFPSCSYVMDHFLSLFDVFLCPRKCR